MSYDPQAHDTGGTVHDGALALDGVTDERTVSTNGVEICAQAFGDAANPALLMVMGANASMLGWDEALCQQFADGGRYVIRFDNRDTGGSTTFPPYSPPYTLEDMARDAVGVLDAYGVARAHVMGISSGGMIVQLLALFHPERIITATVLNSTADPKSIVAATQGTVVEDTLPPPTPAVFALIEYLSKVNWSDEAAAVEAIVTEWRTFAGSAYPFDDASCRAYATQEVRRTTNILSLRFNHPIAEGNTPPWRERLHEIKVPVLVLHGAEDSALPLPHGVALANGIPGATFQVLEGVDHIVPRGAWPIIVCAILAHTASTTDRVPIVRETLRLESSEVVERIKHLLVEGNVRRIVVKHEDRTVLEFPLAVGIVGTLLAPPLAAIGVLAALLNDCTIEVERAEQNSAVRVTSTEVPIVPVEPLSGGQHV